MRYGLYGFLMIKPQTILHYAVQCDYTILRVIFVRFLQLGEQPSLPCVTFIFWESVSGELYQLVYGLRDSEEKDDMLMAH